jgi:Zn-dependent metalloprotease
MRPRAVVQPCATFVALAGLTAAYISHIMSRSSRSPGLFSFVLLTAIAGCSAVTDDMEADDSDLTESAEADEAAAKLRADTGVDWLVDVDPEHHVPDLAMPLSEPKPWIRSGEKASAAALRFFAKYADIFKTDKADKRLRVVREETDTRGFSHVRFAHVENEIDVEGGFSVHFTKKGAIAFINGTFNPDAAPAADGPPIAENEAATEATRGNGFTALRVAPAIIRPHASRESVLTWAVTVGRRGTAQPTATVYVNAHSGAIVEERSRAKEIDATGEGVRFFPPISDPKAVHKLDVTVADGGELVLRTASDGEIPVVTTTPPLGGSDDEVVRSPPYTSADGRTWDRLAAGAPGAGAAVDAHRHTTQVVRWFHDNFRWHRFGDADGKGIEVIVHNPEEMGAAYSTGMMTCGDGNAASGGDQLPLVSLSIVAHELAHGVTDSTSALEALGQPATLNESTSDIFAILIEHEVLGSTDWTVGADASVSKQAIRDLLHPAKGRKRAADARENDRPCNYPKEMRITCPSCTRATATRRGATSMRAFRTTRSH